MYLRSWMLGAAAILGLVCSGQGADELVFSGTFQDKSGRTGPIQCELTRKEPGKWVAGFKAKNVGKGPNGPMNTSVECAGVEEGTTVTFSGEKQLRPGLYVLSMTLVDKKTLNATFKIKSGGGDGTFELTAGKSEAASPAPSAPPAAEKSPAPAPAPAAEPAK